MPALSSAKKRRAEALVAVLDALQALYSEPVCALNFNNPLQLLVATMLSAQCTDKRVNLVTPALFAAYPTAQDMARASQADMEQLVRTTGFFRNKAKNIIAMAELLVRQTRRGGAADAGRVDSPPRRGP